MANSNVNNPISDVIGQYSRGVSPDPIQASSAKGGGLVAQFSDNPFFTAGLGLAGLGAALAATQRGVRHGASLLKRRLLVDVEINVKDESYPWFLYWMTIHARSRPKSLFTPGIHHLSIQTEKIEHPNGAVQTEFVLMPGPGKHILRYKKVFLMVDRVRETKSMDLAKGTPWETVTLTTLYSQRHIFQDLFTEAHQLAQQQTKGKTIIFTPRSLSWEPFGEPRRKRPLESVILDKGIKERIVRDVRKFLGKEKWYQDRGIPYRRGYLLHGPPGTGKSSFIQALAGDLDYNIAMLNLTERGLTDDRLNHLLNVIPQRTIVLLEDADAAFRNRRGTDADGFQGANVSFSGLLNALDGVASAEERILFLTTNHVERLDGALVRPGRVDMTVNLGYATGWQTKQLWERFYGDLDQNDVYRARFMARLEELGIFDGSNVVDGKSTTAAALQGLFLYNEGNMDGAIGMAEGLLPQIFHGPVAAIRSQL